jgi:hypothetical protein
MGEFGRNRVQKELAWQYSVEHLLAAYERVANRKRASAPNLGHATRISGRTDNPLP